MSLALWREEKKCVSPLGRTVLRSGQWITGFQEVELSKVDVVRIQRPDAVLPEDPCEVGVGDEVAADREAPDDLAVHVEEPSCSDNARTRRKARSTATLPSAADGENGSAKMLEFVAIRRYNINVGQGTKKSSGSDRRPSRKWKAA